LFPCNSILEDNDYFAEETVLQSEVLSDCDVSHDVPLHPYLEVELPPLCQVALSNFLSVSSGQHPPFEEVKGFLQQSDFASEFTGFVDVSLIHLRMPLLFQPSYECLAHYVVCSVLEQCLHASLKLGFGSAEVLHLFEASLKYFLSSLPLKFVNFDYFLVVKKPKPAIEMNLSC